VRACVRTCVHAYLRVCMRTCLHMVRWVAQCAVTRAAGKGPAWYCMYGWYGVVHCRAQYYSGSAQAASSGRSATARGSAATVSGVEAAAAAPATQSDTRGHTDTQLCYICNHVRARARVCVSRCVCVWWLGQTEWHSAYHAPRPSEEPEAYAIQRTMCGARHEQAMRVVRRTAAAATRASPRHRCGQR
jgi:hypothetical protein